MASDSVSESDRLVVDIATTRQRLGGVSRTLVYSLIADGQIEAIKVGRRRMIVEASIERLVEAQRRRRA